MYRSVCAIDAGRPYAASHSQWWILKLLRKPKVTARMRYTEDRLIINTVTNHMYREKSQSEN